jgi:hypothetical protein
MNKPEESFTSSANVARRGGAPPCSSDRQR